MSYLNDIHNDHISVISLTILEKNVSAFPVVSFSFTNRKFTTKDKRMNKNVHTSYHPPPKKKQTPAYTMGVVLLFFNVSFIFLRNKFTWSYK